MEPLIAHVRKKDGATQKLWDHLSQVSSLSGAFAEKIGLQQAGEMLGLLHDLGKASNEFQVYLNSATGRLAPDADEYIDPVAQKGKVDHSTAGAQHLYRNLSGRGASGSVAAQLLALCIASHHSGLIDCLAPDGLDNFTRRIEKTEDQTHSNEAYAYLSKDQQAFIQAQIRDEVLIKDLAQRLAALKEANDSRETLTFKHGLLIRFLLSCLLDGDRLDTADFESPGNARIRNYGEYHPWHVLIQRLDHKLVEFRNKPQKNNVDIVREDVSRACLEFAAKPKGILQLTVPTGGGKTLSSLRFALHHAENHDMDRIFYIIPYTSIIDQNAERVREILEDKGQRGNYLGRVVLEHHSNLTPEEETHRQHLLSENWDAPIVFTTQVQFLEALFASGTRGARRMHQLANSVIIFDEVQTIPIRCVHLFNLALRFLVNTCGATVVLCTATQPLLDKVEPLQRALTITTDQRLIPNEKQLFKTLKRVEVFDRRKPGGWTAEEVAQLAMRELEEWGSVLTIVNTRKSARLLFQAIASSRPANIYHLSTNMCPAHRLDVLGEIEDKLGKGPILCVSTQLIEAGVDIDFGSVIRYLAGLDSIAQAAGRCNRNGERASGNVWIVNPTEENIESLKDIKEGIDIAERVLDEFEANPKWYGSDRLGLDLMKRYYEYYFYRRKEEMSYPVSKNSPINREDDLFNLLSVNTLSFSEHERVTGSSPRIPFKQSFRSASSMFRVIDSLTQGVVVPYKEGEEIINDLCRDSDLEKQFGLLRKAQRYSVNLFANEFKKLWEAGAIREVQEDAGVYYLDDQYYDLRLGWSEEPVKNPSTLIVSGG
jgi:CRISPR-associated endonuclease/helicase Cas3